MHGFRVRARRLAKFLHLHQKVEMNIGFRLGQKIPPEFCIQGRIGIRLGFRVRARKPQTMAGFQIGGNWGNS